MAEAFTGFPPSGIAFLAGLAADNTRAYFDRNRSTYAHDVAAPLQTLVIAVGQRLRHSLLSRQDSLPPWVDAIWWAGLHDARRAPAFIFRLSAGGLVAGVGITGLRDTHLDRYRTAVTDDSSGRPLHDLLNQLSASFPTWRSPSQPASPYPLL